MIVFQLLITLKISKTIRGLTIITLIDISLKPNQHSQVMHGRKKICADYVKTTKIFKFALTVPGIGMT